MRINTNISSLVSYNSLARTTGKLEKSIARLSTGLKVATGADDAAGLAISEKMRAQTKGLDRAYQNAQDGISLLQTAEGAIGDIHDALQRMRELSVHAANGAITDDDRIHIQQQVDQLISHINDIATQTQFNKKKLLDGSAAVLWSTDSLDLGIKVSGTLKYLDKLGAVQSAAGNYKITFSETVTGTENIQKSNILTLKHGTHSTNVAFNVSSDSGLANLQAINMVEGAWRLETREVPFGGVSYYIGDGIEHDPLAVGAAKLDATPSPSIVAPGEYDVRLSNKVPMMAEFDDAYTNLVVDGIDVSNRNTSRDFDAKFDIALAAGTASSTRIYDGHNGMGLSVDNVGQNDTTGGTTGMHINTNADNDMNVFTHYSVNATDRRDISSGAITINEDYVTASDAAINLDLNYHSLTGAQANATYTYHASQDGRYSFTLGAFQVDAAHTFTATVTNVDEFGQFVDTQTITANIAAGEDINAIATKISDAFAVNNGDVIVTVDGTGRINIANTNDSVLGRTSQVVIDTTDALTAYLNFDRTTLNNGQSASARAVATGPETVTVDIDAGDMLTTIRGKLNTALSGHGLTVGALSEDAGTHQTTIGLSQTAGLVGHRSVTAIASTGSAQELAFSANTLTYNSTASISTAGKYNGYTHTGIDIGNKDLAGIQTALQAAIRADITAAGGAAAANAVSMAINNSGTAGLDHLTLENGAASQYTITLVSTNDGNFLQSRTANRGQNSNFGNVWNNAHRVVEVGNLTISEIRDRLAAAYNTANGLDSIGTGFGGNDLFSLTTQDGPPATGQIVMNNRNDSAYDIGVSDVTGRSTNTLTEMWTGGKTTARGDGNTASSSEMAYKNTVQTIAAGRTIEQLMDDINGGGTQLKADWVDVAHTPGYDGDHHTGQLTITNDSKNNTGAARRTYVITDSGADNGLAAANARRHLLTAETKLFAQDSGQTFATDSQVWQARDAVSFSVKYEGNDVNGNLLNNAFTIGTGGSAMNAAGADTGNWIWEGDEGADNAARANASAGGRFANFYTNFYIDDTNKTAADTSGTAMLYTKANVVGDATNLTVQLGDSVTTSNNDEAVTYSFNRGALADKDLQLGQMLWTGTGNNAIERLIHNIDFGVNADTNGASFSYGERANAGDYHLDEWGNGNTNHTEAWYAHTYYRTDTTYYFSNSSDPAAVLTDITVHKQNDINASILFTAKDGGLEWKMKTITADGDPGAETTGTITAADLTAGPRGNQITINGVRFTNFDINWGQLTGGDKFVVNVAAAAKTETLNLNGAGNFMSYANVSITGDPFQQGNVRTGSSAQYRLKDGKEDGFTTNPMKLLGYFVDPINGANDTRGVGYYDGDLQLTVAAGGFIDGSTVGDTNNAIGQDTTAHRIHAEVNYQGKTQYSAGALVTSGYFQTMEHDSKLVLADYVKGISYSDYEYEFKDGSWKIANDAGHEKYTKVNGSVIFDVTNIEGNVLTFRVQGHFIDREGKEYYGEEEEFKLHTGPNTERDTSATPPKNTGDHEVEQPVRLFSDIMFADQEYGGIFLNEVTLGDIDIWNVGDRFTVTLTASGFTDNSSIDAQNAALDSDIDEINIFSDNRGSTMPHTFRFNDGVLDNSTTDLRIYQLSNNFVKVDSDKFYRDQVMDGTLRLSFNEYNPPLDPTAAVDPDDPTGGHQRLVHSAATFEVVYGQGDDYGIAHYYSNVEDIAQFWDKNGRYILDGGLETLTIKQGDRETQVNIGQGWEVGELTEALSRAVWNDLLKQHQEGLKGEGELLDMAADKEYMLSKDDMRDIIQFVNTVPGKSDKNSVVGTIVAHSVLSGEGKALEFYGSVDLQNALGFNTIQQGTDTVFNANVSDAHSGKMVTAHNRVVAGTTSYDLLLGEVGLAVDSDLGITRAVYDEVSGTFKLDVKDQFDQYVHLVDNAMTLQIGANEGEDMFLTLGDMSAATLGVASVNVRSREGAARAITMIDNAISRVSYQRAIVGAQINRLEHTMSNLANTSLNLQESRSRIVDANLASEMMNRTKLDIVTQAGAAMLVQANQMGSNVLTLLR